MPRPVAVVVSGALPGDHRREVLRLERGDLPLVDGVVGDAVQADLAVRPLLAARPLDGESEVPGFAGGEDVEIPRRASRPARVEAHAGVAPRHPDFGVHRLPGQPAVLRARQDVGVHLHQRIPERLVVLLVFDALAVGAAGHDDRRLRLGVRSVDVDPQHHPVVHFNGQIAFDDHVRLLGLRMGRRGFGGIRRPPRFAFSRSGCGEVCGKAPSFSIWGRASPAPRASTGARPGPESFQGERRFGAEASGASGIFTDAGKAIIRSVGASLAAFAQGTHGCAPRVSRAPLPLSPSRRTDGSAP